MDQAITALCSGDAAAIAGAVQHVPDLDKDHYDKLLAAVKGIKDPAHILALLRGLHPHDHIVTALNTPRTNLVLRLLTVANISRFPLTTFLTELNFGDAVTAQHLFALKQAYADNVEFKAVTARLFAEKTLSDAFAHTKQLADDFIRVSRAMVVGNTTTLDQDGEQSQKARADAHKASVSAKKDAKRRLDTMRQRFLQLCELLNVRENETSAQRQAVAKAIEHAQDEMKTNDGWFDNLPKDDSHRVTLDLIWHLRAPRTNDLTASDLEDWSGAAVADKIATETPRNIEALKASSTVVIEPLANPPREVKIEDVNAAAARANKRKVTKPERREPKKAREDDDQMDEGEANQSEVEDANHTAMNEGEEEEDEEEKDEEKEKEKKKNSSITPAGTGTKSAKQAQHAAGGATNRGKNPTSAAAAANFLFGVTG